MERQQDEQALSGLSSQIVSMMTTEYYNLQSGRSITVSDANGRSALFIGAVSSALIALAFIGQVSHLGTAFFVFNLVLFPSLVFMGLFTFEHVLQCNIENIICARGMSRIRHLYLEHAPQMQPYIVLSAHDDQGAPFNLGIHRSWREVFFTTAGMIAAINSVLVGVFVGLLLSALFTLPLLVCTSAGVITFPVSLGIHQRYQWGQWRRLQRELPPLFPSKRLQ
jgi:hypothetical protein